MIWAQKDQIILRLQGPAPATALAQSNLIQFNDTVYVILLAVVTTAVIVSYLF